MDFPFSKLVPMHVSRQLYAIYRVSLAVILYIYFIKLGSSIPLLGRHIYVILSLIYCIIIAIFYIIIESRSFKLINEINRKKITLLIYNIIGWSIIPDTVLGSVLVIVIYRESHYYAPNQPFKNLVYVLHLLYWLVAFHSHFFISYINIYNDWVKEYKPKHFLTSGALISVLMICFSGLMIWILQPKDFQYIIEYIDQFKTFFCLSILAVTGVGTWVRIKATRRNKEYDKLKNELQDSHKKSEQEHQLILKASQKLMNQVKRFESYDVDGIEKIELQDLAILIGAKIKCEYCAIGHVTSNKNLRDVGFYLKESNKAKQQILESLKECPMEGSFVGEVLNSDDGYKILTGYPDNANPNIKELTSKVLITNNHRSALVLGVYENNIEYNRGKPIGYIHLINKLDENDDIVVSGFTKEDLKLIQLLFVELIELIFNIFNIKKGQHEDEKFINELMNRKVPNDIILESFKYLSTEFNCHLVSLWMPIQEGFLNEDEENLRVLLRTVVANPEKYGQENSMKLTNMLMTKHSFSISNQECYLGNRVIYDFKNTIENTVRNNKEKAQSISIPIEILSEENFNISNINSWVEFESLIVAESLFVIPIYRTSPNFLPLSTPHENKSPWWDYILGVICLRVSKSQYSILNTPQNSERLKNFARHFSILVENSIYQDRFERLEQLKYDLIRLKLDERQEGNFYNSLVSSIANAMDCEACTLLRPDYSKTHLVIKASNVDSCYINKKKGQNNTLYDTCDWIDKALYPIEQSRKSITMNVYNKKKTFLSSDAENHPEASFNFSEYVSKSYAYKAFIAIPILKVEDETEEVLGVVRCVYKKNEGFLPTFNHFDEEFLSLIVGIVSRYIDYLDFNKNRLKFISTFTHEFAQPLQEIISFTSLIHRQSIKFNYSSFTEKLSIQQDELDQISLILDDFILYISTNSLSNLNIKHQKVYETIKSVGDLLRRKANLEKEISIDIRIGRMEELELNVDINKFKQVLYNLIKNAVHYSIPRKKNIGIYYNRIEENGKVWDTLEVENYGIGIPKKEKESIFNWGYRSTNAIKYVPNGSGIGLYVVKEVMKSHKGYVKVIQCGGILEGDSTIVRIYFPALTNNLL